MKENLLHFIWQYRCYNQNEMESFDGRKIQVLKTGMHNHDAGPDFLDARIKIGETIWAGNVEIHVHQSDWKKHGHQSDSKYDNIVLHVCYFMDTTIPELDKKVPTLVLNGKIKAGLLEKYRALQLNKDWIPCQKLLSKEIIQQQMPLYSFNLCMSRLEKRCNEIAEIFNKNKSDWEASTYILLARSFGSRVNKFAFEQLMQSISHKILMKHSDVVIQLEALLLGQAGLLPTKNAKEKYVVKLQNEYKFLQHKYSLKPIKREVWNYSKLRPANFPDLKIVQFAAFIKQFPQVFSKFRNIVDLKQFTQSFTIKASEYWDTHYRIGKKSGIKRVKKISSSFLNLLLINGTVPMLFYYGKKNDNLVIKEQALNLLEQVPAEKNAIVDNWKKLGYTARNAMESQALIELKQSYCKNIKCLDCRIGVKLFKP